LRDWGRSEQLLREGLAIAEVRDRSDLVERLADLCEGQGRVEEAKEFRREAKRSAAGMETSQSISSTGTVLRQKTKIDFGGEGLPLSELSNVAAIVRRMSSPVASGRPKVGRNDPCPCGSGKKFKKCCRA
jgi:preprotein translocase subunit SecA